MSRFHSVAWCAVGLCLATGPAAADTITTLSVDFESPAFTVGAIGGNPEFSAGQGGWGGFNPGAISTAQAHSGTQSLQSVLAGQFSSAGAAKALDATGGEYPVATSNFAIGYAADWWVQAWVHVTSGGGGARLTLANPLGGCPQFMISGTGTPIIEPCIGGVPPVSLPNEGADLLDQWILMQIVHTTSMFQSFQVSFCIGPNADVSTTLGYAGPPGTSTEQYVVLSGDAYWDDVSAGYGAVPSPVPLPGGAWLLISGLGIIAGKMRRRTA